MEYTIILLNQIRQNPTDIAVSEKLQKITEKIYDIFEKISRCESPLDADPFFDMLEIIHNTITLLICTDQIIPTAELHTFMKEFDRLDSLEEKQFLYCEIKKDIHFLSKPTRYVPSQTYSKYARKL